MELTSEFTHNTRAAVAILCCGMDGAADAFMPLFVPSWGVLLYMYSYGGWRGAKRSRSAAHEVEHTNRWMFQVFCKHRDQWWSQCGLSWCIWEAKPLILCTPPPQSCMIQFQGHPGIHPKLQVTLDSRISTTQQATVLLPTPFNDMPATVQAVSSGHVLLLGIVKLGNLLRITISDDSSNIHEKILTQKCGHNCLE